MAPVSRKAWIHSAKAAPTLGTAPPDNGGSKQASDATSCRSTFRSGDPSALAISSPSTCPK